MTKRKLERFAELINFENVIQPKQEEYTSVAYKYKGKWTSDYFNNSNPVVLELGCGKGEYTVGLAEKYPDINFIGVDIKGERIWKGSKFALDNNMKNVAFLRTRIEMINFFFDRDEVSEIWITFPDPQPNKPRIKKRLTSQQFLNCYSKILRKEGVIHLKTDNRFLFDYTLEVIKEGDHNLIFKTHDLYGAGHDDHNLSIKTYYEQMFLDKKIPICYLKFHL